MTKRVHEAVHVFERPFYTFLVSSDSNRILHPENWGKNAAEGSKKGNIFAPLAPPTVMLQGGVVFNPQKKGTREKAQGVGAGR